MCSERRKTEMGVKECVEVVIENNVDIEMLLNLLIAVIIDKRPVNVEITKACFTFSVISEIEAVKKEVESIDLMLNTGELNIQIADIESIEVCNDGETIILQLINGDVITFDFL